MGYLYFFIVFVLIFLFKRNEASILGKIGEFRVASIIRKINPDFVVLNDLLLPKEDRTTSQVDHIVITRKGIFVIETKNYKADVYGNEYKQKWDVYYSSKRGKKKFTLNNPIHQNYGHIKVLERIFQTYTALPFFNVVVFSNQSTLKVTSSTPVVHMKDLSVTIKKIYLQSPYVLSESDVRHMKRRLDILNQTSGEKHKAHVEHLKQKHGR